MYQRVKALAGKLWQPLVAALALVVSLVPQAQAQVTLPDLGVDTAGTATAIGTALGGVVATTITIFGAFLVVRFGLMWIKRTVK